MKVLSGTVSHRRSEKRGTLQCSRWSRRPEATLNTDIQGKIQCPKVSEGGLHSLITQIGLRLSKLPLDIKVNKKVFQRIVWLLKSIVVISIWRSNIYASLWAGSLDSWTSGSLDPYWQKFIAIWRKPLVVQNWGCCHTCALSLGLQSSPGNLQMPATRSDAPLFPPHVLLTLLTDLLGGTHIETTWDSFFQWTSNANLIFVTKSQMKKTVMRRTYQLGWGVFYSGILDRMNDQRCKLKYTDNVSRTSLDLTGRVFQMIPDTKCSL